MVGTVVDGLTSGFTSGSTTLTSDEVSGFSTGSSFCGEKGELHWRGKLGQILEKHLKRETQDF